MVILVTTSGGEHCYQEEDHGNGKLGVIISLTVNHAVNTWKIAIKFEHKTHHEIPEVNLKISNLKVIYDIIYGL